MQGGCPHLGAERVSSPRSACRNFDLLRVSHAKVTWWHQAEKWWSSTSTLGVTAGFLQDVVPIHCVPLFSVSLVELFDVLVPAYIMELGCWSLDECPMFVVSVVHKVGW